jgi:hypothetical protein
VNRRVYADPDHGRESIIIKVNIKFVFGAVQDALDTQHPEPPVFFTGKDFSVFLLNFSVICVFYQHQQMISFHACLDADERIFCHFFRSLHGVFQQIPDDDTQSQVINRNMGGQIQPRGERNSGFVCPACVFLD